MFAGGGAGHKPPCAAKIVSADSAVEPRALFFNRAIAADVQKLPDILSPHTR